MAKATVKAPKIVGMMNFMMAMNGMEFLLELVMSFGQGKVLIVRRFNDKVERELNL